MNNHNCNNNTMFVSIKKFYKDSFSYFLVFGNIKKNESKENYI